MQELQASQQPAFRIDSALLASTQPGLVLSQSSCAVCDPVAEAAAEVSVPLPGAHLWGVSLWLATSRAVLAGYRAKPSLYPVCGCA